MDTNDSLKDQTTWDLYLKLPPDGNLFFSPVSVRLALCLAALGARVETRRQMCEVLGLPDDDQAIADEIVRVTGAVASRDIKIEMGNRLFAEKTFPFKKDYLELAARFSGFEPVDFIYNTDGVRRHINDWVEEKTHGRICNLLPEGSLDSNTTLVIVNAIYFLGKWAYEFDPDNTSEETFHAPWRDYQVKMMYQTGQEMPYGTIQTGQVLAIPYQGRGFSMIVAVPHEGTDLVYLEEEVTQHGGLYYLMDALTSQPEITLWMPQFEMTGEYSLNDSLQRLGMTDAFVDHVADFTGICPVKGHLYVKDVFHKAFVRVSEEGTEAAAATAVAMAFECCIMGKEAETVRLDRPFIFFIINDETRDVLFVGRVFKPEALKSESAFSKL